jgi:Uma2 family endonuclease
MSTATADDVMFYAYKAAALDYVQSRTLEDLMEAVSQATQRRITLASFALLRTYRPEVQYFNELLVQYPQSGEKWPGQVVPDNMVVLWDTPLEVEGSYDVPLQPTGPFWVLEYVSKHNRRKDYEESWAKYEEQLKVPYYLLFRPDTQDLKLYHHSGQEYVAVPPHHLGRHPLPELELEVGLLNGWVRYWFRGELLLLPEEMQQQLTQERQARVALEQELARLKAQLAQRSSG